MPVWHRAGPHRGLSRLLKALGTAQTCHCCFSQTEQQSIRPKKCFATRCGNQSTKEVKLPHSEADKNFWCFPHSTATHTLFRNTNKLHLPSGTSTRHQQNWTSSPSCLNQISKSSGWGSGTKMHCFSEMTVMKFREKKPKHLSWFSSLQELNWVKKEPSQQKKPAAPPEQINLKIQINHSIVCPSWFSHLSVLQPQWLLKLNYGSLSN